MAANHLHAYTKFQEDPMMYEKFFDHPERRREFLFAGRRKRRSCDGNLRLNDAFLRHSKSETCQQLDKVAIFVVVFPPINRYFAGSDAEIIQSESESAPPPHPIRERIRAARATPTPAAANDADFLQSPFRKGEIVSVHLRD